MSNLQRPAVFVLTFPGAGTDRHQSPQQEFERLPIELGWSLVMGFGPQDQIVEEVYDADLNQRWMKRPLAASEIAVYAGHRKMYAEFLSGSAEFGLFLEDDFQISHLDDFCYLVEHIESVMASTDMLKLFNFGDKPGWVVRQRTSGPLQLVKHHRNSAGAVAYVLSRHGAEKLLAKSKLYRQIDEDFKYHWEFDLNIWSLAPDLVTENSSGLGGSLLEMDRRTMKQNHRNVVTSMKGNYLTIRRKLLGLYHSLSTVRD